MSASPKLAVVATEPARPPAQEPRVASRLLPTFRVELRRRHDDNAPVDALVITARTLASARHAARRQRPDAVILSVTRL
jgi:hypothetical protein